MYTSLEAQLHDLFWEAEGPSAELPLLRSFLVANPGPALELGCGSGRLLLPLLADGFPLEGLDNAPEMLELCRQKAAAQNLSPSLHLGDLAHLTLEKKYQTLSIPAFTFQFLPNPASTLKQLPSHLLPGGSLFLTVFSPLAELEGDLPENERYLDHELELPDGSLATIHTRHQLDRKNRILTREHFYELSRSNKPTQTHQTTHRLRYFNPNELESLLQSSAFEIQLEILDFGICENPDETAGITTFIARRETSR